MGLASTDIRNPSRSNGFFEDFRMRVDAFYGGGGGLRYESRVANAIMKSITFDQPGISVFMKCSFVKPIRILNKVQGAVLRDCVTHRTGRVCAKVTIDATDEGDFAAACGCEFRAGREPRTPEEPHAGVIYFDDKTQEILPGSTGAGDKRQQSYAYLMIWKDYGAKGAAPAIKKPRLYRPQVYCNSSGGPDLERNFRQAAER